MTPRSGGGPDGTPWPGQPGGEWPGDLWPGDGAGPAPGAAAAGARGGRGVRPGALAAVAVVAGLAGAGIPLAVHALSGPPARAEGLPLAGQPSVLPGGAGGRPGAPGGLPGAGRLFLAGRVTAVSGTSITIGGPGRPVTAAVTGATRVSGPVGGLRGIRVGDRVSAQLAQRGNRAVAVAIQDPAQPPGGGAVP